MHHTQCSQIHGRRWVAFVQIKAEQVPAALSARIEAFSGFTGLLVIDQGGLIVVITRRAPVALEAPVMALQCAMQVFLSSADGKRFIGRTFGFGKIGHGG